MHINISNINVWSYILTNKAIVLTIAILYDILK